MGATVIHELQIQDGKDRCPTLELLERCNVLDPTNPLFEGKKEVGL